MQSPAQIVIERLGGIDKVAEVAGVDVSRVYRWTYPVEKGGTGGQVPQRHHRTLLDYAAKHGIALNAAHLVIGLADTDPAASRPAPEAA